MNVAEMWDICIKFMWDENYINELDQFLKSNNTKTILDCGGGTGFPSINLKKRGWDISYCDTDKTMFQHFQNKIKEQNIQIPHFLSSWLELSKNIDQKFDAVLCRGNSLIYVDSWNVEKLKLTKKNIQKSLEEFYNILDEKGLLYVDIINEKEFNKDKYPLTEYFGEKVINNQKVKVIWELTHDYKNKIRTWKCIITINDKKYEFVNYSYLLEHKELINLLKGIGFKNVKETMIAGENNYNVFIAYK